MNRLVATLLAVGVSLTSALTSYAAPVRIDNTRIGKQLDLPMYEWVDQSVARKGTIVAVHGLTLYAECWDDMAKHLAHRGYHVFALTQRGFGRWQTEGAKFDGNNKIFIAQSQQDLLDLVTNLRQYHKGEPLIMLGESLGSNMILLLLSEHPELADAAILGSPCYKTRVHPKPLHWAKDFATELVLPDHPLNLEPYAAPYLTNIPSVAAACNSDPMINRRLTPAELIKFDLMDDRAIKAARNLPANLPVLVIAGAKDAMFKSTDLPEEVQKWGSKKITCDILPGKGHLLMEHQPVNRQVASIIDAWLLRLPSTTGLASKQMK